MSCHCAGKCRTCSKMGGAAGGTGPGKAPVNFPSVRQARLAVGETGYPGVPHAARATEAVRQPSTSGQGTAALTVGTAPWSVPAPNWGSMGQIRWGRLVKNAARQVIDYLPFSIQTAPFDATPRVRRTNHPALDERGYNLRAITDAQINQLALARAKARAGIKR
jgi:hypothetical protein